MAFDGMRTDLSIIFSLLCLFYSVAVCFCFFFALGRQCVVFTFLTEFTWISNWSHQNILDLPFSLLCLHVNTTKNEFFLINKVHSSSLDCFERFEKKNEHFVYTFYTCTPNTTMCYYLSFISDTKNKTSNSSNQTQIATKKK